MIFTKIKIDNLYCFKNAEIDLSYPRKIKNSAIEYEYLENAPNFRFKRLCIISGANASGKTSFGRVLCAIQNVLSRKKINSVFLMKHQEKKNATIAAEFVIPDKEPTKFYYFELILPFEIEPSFDERAQYQFKFVAVPIEEKDSVEKCRSKVNGVLNGENLSENVTFIDNTFDVLNEDIEEISRQKWREFGVSYGLPSKWVFSFSEHSDRSESLMPSDLNKETATHYKHVLESVLKTFDQSIDKVGILTSKDEDDSNDNVEEQVVAFPVTFKNKNRALVSIEGKVIENESLFSMGTHQGISVANFIYYVMDKNERSALLFLDEKMAYSHSEIEKVIVNLIVQKMSRYSQFFYTTHNYDILRMGFPLHSYVFMKKENDNVSFIWASNLCKKNDRSIVSYVEANCFNTIPDTYLLDELLWKE